MERRTRPPELAVRLPHVVIQLHTHLTHSLTDSLAHSLTHSTTHPLTHSLAHSLTHSTTQSIAPTRGYTHQPSITSHDTRFQTVWDEGRTHLECILYPYNTTNAVQRQSSIQPIRAHITDTDTDTDTQSAVTLLATHQSSRSKTASGGLCR